MGEDFSAEQMLALAMELGAVNLQCMALLDRANTETLGTPTPAEVSLKVEKGPFIVVTGHDLYDLKLLLEQTEGKGVNVYTHGEMLPAHGYPELRKFPHLKGNFGTAWQNQQKRICPSARAHSFFTSNCLMPVKESWRRPVFTTEAVSYPLLHHIGRDKDFPPVIQAALMLGGFSEDTPFTGINGGQSVTTRVWPQRSAIRGGTNCGSREIRRHSPLLPGGRLRRRAP